MQLDKRSIEIENRIHALSNRRKIVKAGGVVDESSDLETPPERKVQAVLERRRSRRASSRSRSPLHGVQASGKSTDSSTRTAADDGSETLAEAPPTTEESMVQHDSGAKPSSHGQLVPLEKGFEDGLGGKAVSNGGESESEGEGVGKRKKKPKPLVSNLLEEQTLTDEEIELRKEKKAAKRAAAEVKLQQQRQQQAEMAAKRNAIASQREVANKVQAAEFVSPSTNLSEASATIRTVEAPGKKSFLGKLFS
jgi:hypothetical protein